MIGQRGEFHLAQVDDAVGTRYDKVNLGTLLFLFLVLSNAPGRSLGGHARDAESLLDLGEMEQAENLEAEALPVVNELGLKVVKPPLLVLRTVVGNEMVVKQGIEIDKTVDDILGFMPEMLVSEDKVAALKIAEHLGEDTTFDFDSLYDLLAGEAVAVFCQGLYDTDIAVGLVEEGIVELVELGAQRSVR